MIRCESEVAGRGGPLTQGEGICASLDRGVGQAVGPKAAVRDAKPILGGSRGPVMSFLAHLLPEVLAHQRSADPAPSRSLRVARGRCWICELPSTVVRHFHA